MTPDNAEWHESSSAAAAGGGYGQHGPPPGYGHPLPQGTPAGHPSYPSPYYVVAAAPPTNTMAILAIIFAFVFSPLGIVFGLIGRSQIRRTGESGDGLALAGLIFGAVFTALSVASVVFVIITMAATFSAIPALAP
jgi:hypothetical protein